MKIRGLKYGAVIVAGILLCTAPLTVWAEKTAEAVETSVADNLEEKTEETKAEAVETETKASEAESKADETETKVEETKASEEETKETEEIGDGEVKADDETAETKADETVVEEEITDDVVATESDAVQALETDVIGTWSVDDEAGMRFEDGGLGALILPKTSYAFTYVVEDDQLILDFESNKVVDCRYTASVSGDVLTLIGGEGTVGGTYELAKN